MPTPLTFSQARVPLASEAPNGASALSLFGTDIDSLLVLKATSVANRDALYANVPAGTLVSCAALGIVWQKVTTPPTAASWVIVAQVPAAPVTSGIATAFTNWTLVSQWGQLVNGQRTIRLQFTYGGTDITSGAAGSAGPGNINDTQIATMDPVWAPPNNMNSFFRSAICGGGLEVRTTANSGGVWITDLYTSGLIRNGDALSFSTTYPSV